MNTNTVLLWFYIAYVLIDAKISRIIVRIVVRLYPDDLTDMRAQKTGVHRGGEKA